MAAGYLPALTWHNKPPQWETARTSAGLVFLQNQGKTAAFSSQNILLLTPFGEKGPKEPGIDVAFLVKT
jgi:hypothetical protein